MLLLCKHIKLDSSLRASKEVAMVRVNKEVPIVDIRFTGRKFLSLYSNMFVQALPLPSGLT